MSAVPSDVAQSFGVKPMDKTWVEFIELGLKIIAVGAGGVAAWFWYCASKVIPTPTWARGDMPFEPVIPELAQDGWIVGLLEAASESARLNKIAALWTAASVLLSALSIALGAVASSN